MKFIYLLFFTVLSSITVPTYALQKSNNIDEIISLLDGNAIFDMDYDYPALKRYAYTNDSSAIVFILDFIKTQKSNNNNHKVFKGLFVLGQLNLYKHNYPNAEKYLHKAINVASNGNEIIIATNSLSNTKMKSDSYSQALEYIRQIKKRIKYKKNSVLLAKLLIKEAYCYTKLEKFKIAKSHFDRAYSVIEKNKLNNLYGTFFMYKGLFFYKQSDNLNALANFYKGLKFFNQDTVISNYVVILDYIGKIYFYQQNYKKALKSFIDVEALYNELGDIRGVGFANIYIANTYIKLNIFDLAKEHLDKANRFFDIIDYKKGFLTADLKFIQLYNQINEPDSVKIYLDNNSSIISEVYAKDYEYEYYKQYARYYLNKKMIDSAIYFSEKAFKHCTSDCNIHRQIDCKRLHVSIYRASGDYKSAYKNQTFIESLSDSLHLFENSYEINIIQSELEASRREVVINTLTNERKKQDTTIKLTKIELKKQKGYVFAGILFLVFLVVFILLISAYVYQKRKDNKILHRRNIKIAQQKEEIELQSEHLMEVNKEMESLSLVARETDNGIKIMSDIGNIIWINEGYVNMHGYSLSELQLKSDNDILGNNTNVDIQQLVNVWYGDKKPITFESLNKTKAGANIWVQTTLTPIVDNDGKISRMISIDSDITRIKKAEEELMSKNIDVTASISYAKRIQEAMMVPFSTLTDHCKNSFNFYKPKSIVSGDFYWLSYRHDRVIVVCADSTGHGVPGAFMSMIGMSFLNKIVNEKGFISPDIILNRMRMNIINHLHQHDSDLMVGDGMDMSIVSIDLRNKQVEYAGAMNSIYISRDGELIELKPDRMPVGFFDNEDRPFASTLMDLEKDDTIYMFTDGYYDQFGGETGSKMKGKLFREILKKASKQPVCDQKQIVEDEFNKWKGEYSQVDDVLLMGIGID